MINIILMDLANDLIEIDNKSIPLGVGYIGAYCKRKFDSEVSISVFKNLDLMLNAIKEIPPDIAGFGCYDWNYNLSLNVAQQLKKMFPKCFIVFGGANVDKSSEENEIFLNEYPFVDALVFGDGEYVFSNIVKHRIDFNEESDPIKKIRSTPIDGVRALDNGRLVMGAPTDLVENLDEIPSPYLTGMFDGLLKNVQLMPIVQNVRGCPFTCSFCVSGSQPGKLRAFSVERVISEIDYIRKNSQNKLLRFSDDNFGIVQSDLEVAKFLNETHEQYQYPAGLKMYSSKHLNERTRKIALLLKKLNLMNISFQSLNPVVLNNIKRHHNSLDEIKKNIDFAALNNIPTGTELIFGLPGETFDSFMEVIDKVVELGFDSVVFGVLWILPGTELATQKAREEYNFKSKFMLAENAVSLINGEISFEADEIVVSSNTYSYDEFKLFIKHQFLCEFSISYGFARELLFHALSFSIKPSEIFGEIFSSPESYPVINKTCEAFQERYIGHMFDTEEELNKFVSDNYTNWVENKENLTSISKTRAAQEFLGKILYQDTNLQVFDEFEKAILILYKGKNKQTFDLLTRQVKNFSVNLIINPLKEIKKEILFISDYNFIEWIKGGYKKKLSDFIVHDEQGNTVKKHFKLTPRNCEFINYVVEKDKKEGKKFFNFFRYTNSTDLKRIIKQEI